MVGGWAYLALINLTHEGRSDAIGVIDVDPGSKSYGQLVGQTDMPQAGDELHHFGWNACSSCLCPYAPHPHMERRYLIVPGINSSRIHILDTKPDPRKSKSVICLSTHDPLRAGRPFTLLALTSRFVFSPSPFVSRAVRR